MTVSLESGIIIILGTWCIYRSGDVDPLKPDILIPYTCTLKVSGDPIRQKELKFDLVAVESGQLR